MGFMTLTQMQDELALNLSGEVSDKDRLTLWLNFGLMNLASHLMFDELETAAVFNTTDGVTDYAAPTDLLGIITIKVNRDAPSDATGAQPLRLRKMRREYLTASADAIPTHYKRRGSQIVVWPTPDANRTGEIVYVRTPAVFAAAGGTSPFSSTWDVGIIMLATYQGLVSLGRQDEADRWLGRFLGYANSRITEADIGADAPRDGLNVAWTHDDLHENPPHLEG